MQIIKLLIITFGLVLLNTFIGSYEYSNVHGLIVQSTGVQQQQLLLELRSSTRRSTFTSSSSSSSSSSFSQKMTAKTAISATKENDNDKIISSVIKNFRQVTGFQKLLFRCASTDGLGDLLYLDDNDYKSISVSSSSSTSSTTTTTSSPEYKILHDIGLILDLRSPSERNEKKAREWMSIAPGGEFTITTFDRNQHSSSIINMDHNSKRNVLRIDVLSPSAKCFIIMDCCNSATNMNLPFQYDSNEYTESDLNLAKIIKISGCRDNQTSADYYDRKESNWQGALTNSFLRTLSLDENISSQYNLIKQDLKMRRFSQKPVLSFSDSKMIKYKLY